MKDNEIKKTNTSKRKHFINLSHTLTTISIIGGGILVFFALYRFESITKIIKNITHILAPVIYGLGFAYILNPMVRFWERKFEQFLNKKITNIQKLKKASRSFGIFISLLLTIVALYILFLLVIPELIETIYGLVISIPSQMEEFEHYITGIMDANNEVSALFQTVIVSLGNWFESWLKNDLLKQVTGLTTGIFNVVNVLIDIILGFIISVYVLSSKETFITKSKMIIYAIFSTEKANAILKIARKSNHIFSGFISGKLIDSVIIGILCFIGLSIMDMPYVILVSVIVGVTNVIPFFGPYIGAIPSAFLILLANPIKGIYFIIFIIILQQIDGNIIGPKILGEFTGLTAFWVVFSILLGGGLFGFIGMLLGVPIFAVLYYIAGQVMEHLLRKKNLPTTEEHYSNLHHIEPDLTFLSIEEYDKMEIKAAENTEDKVSEKENLSTKEKH